jgi:broad specificity phosphatase PhoE
MSNTPRSDRQVAPMRRRIYLMRHGEVSYFDADGRAHDPASVPLTAQGRAQADAAGAAFAQAAVRFDRVIVSGLPRTRETAERVLVASAQSLDYEIWPEWREIEGGRLSALAPAEIESAFLDVFRGGADENTRFLGGETLGALLDRVLPGLARLRADRDWQTALLVLHGGVNRAILSHALTGGARAFFGQLEQEPACINCLDVGEAAGDWVVRAVNYAPGRPLLHEQRDTTMESLYAAFLRSRRT